MAYLYILLTAKGTYYVGSTENLGKRLQEHNQGRVKSTHSKPPVQLVYKEFFHTRGEAQKKEYRIKRWKSKKLIESLVRKSTAPSSSPV